GWLMAGEPTFAVGHVVSPNRRARRKATNREDKTGYTEAQPSQLKSQKKIPCSTYTNERKPSKRKYTKLSSRHQKCLLWNRVWWIWIPITRFSIKAQEISRKSHMHWMSLKLQVSQAGRVSLSIDVVF
ncbi:unnamed protein product, partial [Penicillium nalgiovense]